MNLYSYPQRTLETILGIGDCISGTNNRLHIVKYSGDFKDAAVMGDAFLIWELSGDNKLQKILTESGKEFIVLNRAGKSYKGSCVIHDYEYSCQKSVDVLLDAGHSKIAFLGETPTGVSLDESKVLEEYINKKGAFFSQEDFLCFRDDSPEQIKGVAETVLKRNYSAIIASNDMKGYKIINELGKSGISVPDDISVIGNHRVDTPFDIPVDLTSFITPWGAMGKRGAELLLSRSKLGEGFSRSVVREIIEPVFYEGKSVRSLS